MPKNFIAKNRQPKAVSDILHSSLKYLHLDKKLEEYAAFPHWEEVVGESIAKVATPEKIVRGKILVVRVIDAVWAQELSFKKTEIIEKIHRLGIGAIIEDIRFIHGRKSNSRSK